ncbi:Fe-S cluster assembly sulfur transfer protein SufU [Alicyclobacillus tolerans]|uniref:Nitrogen fixation NifU-like protein n=2 Tax=Alicyclobacillus tolerans TaxID=90970 RepID=A0ABT9LTJ6_9BACL|nr:MULTISPECIES: SUF system NifU family Fe-S cluster assembly protein [Alicyclobacillus]MDP9727576.1 nitrogen fixation NifU-like protein [Alicyclobacillus tengchongensis]QRF24007.1 SUF system NifU family Fe-S cluster assembly protein [Alicyclobacillus sp. TC]SHJ66110.1 nitrogen fixation protein NifU [Alicyclobacillus montanus]
MQLDELYRQVIMDHYQHPRNQGKLEEAAVSVELRNPSCGDEIRLQLLLQDGKVEDVRFEGSGCSISMASASMMTEAIKGQSVDKALELAHQFRAMMRGEEVDAEALGDLEALQGVSKFPARIKCATLAWQALDNAAKTNS